MAKKTNSGGSKKADDDNTVAGYSGSPVEGAGPSKPEEGKKWSKDAVHSPAGSCEPTQVFQGDGLTPHKG